MINKNKFRLTLTFLALLLLFSILFIFFGNREVYVVSKDKSFGEPQKGYIIQVDTKKSTIFVVSDLTEKEMKTWKLDWEGWENIQRNLGRNMCYYFVDDKSVLKKLKIGNEVTIYNNGNIVTSKPSFTTATKIIVKKPFFKELIN